VRYITDDACGKLIGLKLLAACYRIIAMLSTAGSISLSKCASKHDSDVRRKCGVISLALQVVLGYYRHMYLSVVPICGNYITLHVS
jgi:hypothetical protein